MIVLPAGMTQAALDLRASFSRMPPFRFARGTEIRGVTIVDLSDKIQTTFFAAATVSPERRAVNHGVQCLNRRDIYLRPCHQLRVEEARMTILQFCVKLLALTALLGLVSNDGWTQTYPSKPVRYLSGASTGSGGDTLGRLLAAELGQAFGQQVLVDNRPGAGGNLVAELAAKSSPDGYTILQGTAAYAVYASLYRNLSTI